MPMTPKLHKFRKYVAELLPHELDYLASQQQFIDHENTQIFEKISQAQKLQQEYLPDINIDKRKYSRLMHWIDEKLSKIDVDKDYKWLLDMEEKVMTDTLQPKDEKEIVKRIKHYGDPCYNFMRLYQLCQQFSNFLMIRMRSEYQKTVMSFLENHRSQYLKCRDTYQQLNDVTGEIVSQYQGERLHTRHYESWLTSVFQNVQLDGFNRYSAIVRLTFLYYNYKDYSKLKELYLELDHCFSEGLFYSRRILVNYYSNRVLMHAQSNEWDQAEMYAFLSIKHKGSDYIHYLNNLSAILLRSGKSKAALEIMKESFNELKNTTSGHNKVGFVGLYVKALNQSGFSLEGMRYALTYLEAHKADIHQHRWHLFFTSLLQAQILQQKFREAIQTIQKHKLIEKDANYIHRSNYIPTIPWYLAVSQFKLKDISYQDLTASLLKHLSQTETNEHVTENIKSLYREIRKSVPQLPISIEALKNINARSST